MGRNGNDVVVDDVVVVVVDDDVVDVVVEVPSPEIACKVRKRRSLFCAMFNLVHEL